jgi:hypothetical protein
MAFSTTDFDRMEPTDFWIDGAREGGGSDSGRSGCDSNTGRVRRGGGGKLVIAAYAGDTGRIVTWLIAEDMGCFR